MYLRSVEEGEKEMRIVCSWCGKDMGVKKGRGITHGICEDCIKKIENGEHKSTKQSHDNTTNNS